MELAQEKAQFSQKYLQDARDYMVTAAAAAKRELAATTRTGTEQHVDVPATSSNFGDVRKFHESRTAGEDKAYFSQRKKFLNQTN